MSRGDRTRGREQGNPVSLFPFLAVLICTMGALILLLVLIAESTRSQVTERENVNTDEIVRQMQLDAESAEVMANDLLVSKQKTLADIEKHRAQLAAIENSIEKMVADIERTENMLREIENRKADVPTGLDQLKGTLAEKKQALQQSEAELAELKKNGNANQKSYAIIPYHGLNGTNRKPVYIECRADSVIIQPEGIVLKDDDFITASHPDNPLDAVLRAASQFYSENSLTTEETRSYPLILVRPEGIEAYYAVRESLQSWGNNFGYELVESDWQLDFPKADAALAQRLDTQLQASRERMLPIKRMILQQYLAARQMQNDRGNGRVGNGMTGAENTNAEDDGNLSGNNSSMDGLSGVDWKAVASMQAREGNSSNKDNQETVYRVKPNGGMEQVENRGISSFDPGAFPSERNRNSRMTNNSANQTANNSNSINKNADNGAVNSNVGNVAETTNNQQLPLGGISLDAPLPKYGNNVQGNADHSQKEHPQTENMQANTAEYSAWDMIRAEQEAKKNTEKNRITNSIPLDPRQELPVPPSEGFSSTAQQHEYDRRINEMRDVIDHSWTGTNVSHTTIGIVRPVIIECWPEKVVFKAMGRSGINREIPIPADGQMQSITYQLANAVWDYTATWGEGMSGNAWKAELNVAVKPNAEQQSQQLIQILHGSGLTIVKQ